jgi:hypothetical protein
VLHFMILAYLAFLACFLLINFASSRLLVSQTKASRLAASGRSLFFDQLAFWLTSQNYGLHPRSYLTYRIYTCSVLFYCYLYYILWLWPFWHFYLLIFVNFTLQKKASRLAASGRSLFFINLNSGLHPRIFDVPEPFAQARKFI